MSQFYENPGVPAYPAPQPEPRRSAGRTVLIITAVGLAALAVIVTVLAFGPLDGTGSASAAVPVLTGPSPATSGPSNPNDFAPPTFIPPGALPTNHGNLTDTVIPTGLTVDFPAINVKNSAYILFAANARTLTLSVIEAWAVGATDDARYDSWCTYGCRGTVDPLITRYATAHASLRGRLSVYGATGGFADGSTTSAVYGVCLDDANTTVLVKGTQQANPYKLGPTFWAFGLVLDTTERRWVATEAYMIPDSAYCTSQ